MSERFHIGEWYGFPFLDLPEAERVALSRHKVGGHIMKKDELERLEKLETKRAERGLTRHEEKRLTVLRNKLAKQKEHERPCPFRTDSTHPVCTKPGGVCSLQLLTDDGGVIAPANGERGMVRALCPYRFHQDDTIFQHIGARLLDNRNPIKIGEVGFLRSTGNLDSLPDADVGYIDMILASPPDRGGAPLEWVAVEIQAVYFSGPEMSKEFRHIQDTNGALSMAQSNRRPDYRSSGPKRLMPQLQIKVPTLRRWGKKMAVVVDVPFFRSMGKIPRVMHVSNADIVWYLVAFTQPAGGGRRRLEVVDEVYTTLEDSIAGLTGGVPVPLPDFEQRIIAKAGLT